MFPLKNLAHKELSKFILIWDSWFEDKLWNERELFPHFTLVNLENQLWSVMEPLWNHKVYFLHEWVSYQHELHLHIE